MKSKRTRLFRFLHSFNVLLAVLAAVAFTGCVGLKPGADPIIVRAEQTQAIAPATFNAILKLDDSNRALSRSNAPAFHEFCEWLRAPVTITVTNLHPGGPQVLGAHLPRGLAMVWSLDQTKLAYKHGLATSNTVVGVLATVESALAQAQQHYAAP